MDVTIRLYDSKRDTAWELLKRANEGLPKEKQMNLQEFIQQLVDVKLYEERRRLERERADERW